MRKRRLLILVVGLPIYGFLLMVVATIVLISLFQEAWEDVTLLNIWTGSLEILADPDWWLTVGIGALVVIATQIVFLIPVSMKQPQKGQRSMSLFISLMLGAIVAGLLCMGLGFGLIDLLSLLMPSYFELDSAMESLWLIPMFMLVAGWGFWSMILLFFTRGVWADRTLGRIVGLLVAGTLLEALLLLPLNIMVRHRTDCYCSTGSFFAICTATLAALWLTGPGIVIALTIRKRRAWKEKYCWNCGYEKGPTPGEACPECGYRWGGEASKKRAAKGTRTLDPLDHNQVL